MNFKEILNAKNLDTLLSKTGRRTLKTRKNNMRKEMKRVLASGEDNITVIKK